MTAITNSTTAGTSAFLASQAQAGAIPSATASTTSQSAATGAVDTVTLSDRAQAILDKANADKAATAKLALSFDEMLQQRTDALTAKLTDAFKKLNVNLDDAVRLQVDKFGNVTAEGPWKAKIEKYFADNPDVAKELKEISGLNALKAANAALELYNKEKGSSAQGSKQQQSAWSNYNIRSMNIQTLSGVISLKDGQLRSAALDYIDSIADPTGAKAGPDLVQQQREVASRLA
ncbi:hypothetical protein [Rhodopseudomonas palustris]|uniref:Uncharacterized protein n=1 Tax=Rhodopseudomonas palustris (strain ATCC BAA-98 / CGA009) TaxID=258594 RepID=Q6N4E8_RHOPA|nr:hypothetical protein [Rhodopseudomonas palustris]OPF96616.1 hypothetical protein B1S06_03400 [Rhodopseudomonas palustris]PPQ44105.1 hypothetical protein CKO39_07660 [Rhodopseudomonas palustris]QQM04925.1 hypothetical protein I8G32_03490 [Rhodopseudomonas palustris]RJF65066.1 hypothetical protein D4Q71_09755 [Rhodopseudomonas palustris]WAB76291.1 hypothetical protein OR798_17530 [Rhodopseudomonas palustris]